MSCKNNTFSSYSKAYGPDVCGCGCAELPNMSSAVSFNRGCRNTLCGQSPCGVLGVNSGVGRENFTPMGNTQQQLAQAVGSGQFSTAENSYPTASSYTDYLFVKSYHGQGIELGALAGGGMNYCTPLDQTTNPIIGYSALGGAAGTYGYTNGSAYRLKDTNALTNYGGKSFSMHSQYAREGYGYVQPRVPSGCP